MTILDSNFFWRAACATLLSLALGASTTTLQAADGSRAERPIGGIEQLPNAALGEIDGAPAVLFWPVDTAAYRLRDVSDCTVYVQPYGEVQGIFSHKCGEWFVPPKVGRYEAWLEMPGQVSEIGASITYGGGAFRGTGARILVPTVASGTLVMPRGAVPPRAATLRVLAIASDRQPYERRLTVSSDAVPVPAGRVVAGYFDAAGNALTITEPAQVTAGQRETASFGEDAKTSRLLLVLSNAAPGTRCWITADGRRHDPDVVTRGRTKILAIWYGLTSEHATVYTGSDSTAAIAHATTALARGQVTTVRVTADVRVTSPAGPTARTQGKEN